MQNRYLLTLSESLRLAKIVEVIALLGGVGVEEAVKHVHTKLNISRVNKRDLVWRARNLL